MTAKDSSSSATSHSDLFRLELGDRLPAFPRALLDGRDSDLLEPIGFFDPAAEPPGLTSGSVTAPRPEVAQALGDANREYGHPRAGDLADKLADPETRVVVTGQQPGLFGGPLLGLSKTLAAIKHAEALEAKGIRAVAVFWVATEDHDWAEIASATFLNRQGPVTLSLGEDREPLRPVGRRHLGDDMPVLAERARELFFGDDAVKRLERILEVHHTGATVGEAFIRTMLEVLGDRAPLYLDAQLPALKALQRPMLRALVERRSELDAAYAAADAALTDRGYGLQVTPQPGVSPLFLELDGERRRIEWRGDDRFSLRGRDDYEAPVDDLLRILDGEPGRVSPGVLARPAIQDALLGTTLQILGPSELSYMPQAAPAHALLGLRGVQTILRPQTMVLDGKTAGWLQELELPLESLLTRPLEEALAERVGDDLVTPVRDAIEAQLETLRRAALEVDKSLAKPFDKTRDHIGRGLETLSAKIAGAVARRHEVWLKRLQQAKANLVPGGAWMERRLATAFLHIRHGEALAETLDAQLNLDPRHLSVIELD
ncbi:MAG: bacillithiol biosynthesis BshC [Acidobacteriota bacterium]